MIDSRFLAVDPYSSRVYSTGPEGYVPSFEENPWIMTGQDSNVSWDVHGAHAPRCWPLVGPSLSIPYSKGAWINYRTHQWADLRTPGPRQAIEVLFALYFSCL